MASDKTNRKLEYLDQGYAVRRNNQTLALQFALSPPSNTDSVPVLSLHSPYSRFVLTLIDLTGNERKIMKANIRADEVPYLLRQYELAIRGKYEFLMARGKDDAAGTASNPAFKVQIRAGALKGRTPGEVLLENQNSLVTESGWRTTWEPTPKTKKSLMQSMMRCICTALDSWRKRMTVISPHLR